ncbi:deaminase [Kribbella sp. NPDC020789]
MPISAANDQDLRPRMRPVVILTGPFGTGLSTAADHIERAHGYQRVHLADELKLEWSARYDDQRPVRSDLQWLGDELRQSEGSAVLVERALRKPKIDLSESIVIESIKNVGEIAYLRQVFGYRAIVVAVQSEIETRLSRATARYTAVGLDRDHITEDDLRDRNEEVEYGQQVELCMDLADIVVLNTSATTDLAYVQKIDELIALVQGAADRGLTNVEIYMHAAYSLARSSKCLKRHVGAVLVDSLDQLVAGGFNENPSGTKPCIEEPDYGFQCHRDIVRRDHFENLARRGARCPVCDVALSGSDGPPWRCDSCYKRGRKTNLETFFFPDRAMSWCTAVHAEVRAILAAGEKARRSTLYTTTFPCMQCAEKIVQSGIAGIVYTEAYPDPHSASRLQKGGVSITQFEGVRSSAVERLFPNPWQPVVRR